MNFFNVNLDELKSNDVTYSDGFDFDKMYNESFVDLAEETPPIVPLISIGCRVYNQKSYDIYACTEGEMSAIVAPSKTMKSFFATSLVSAFIGGKKIQEKFPILKSHRAEKCTVLHFDTEQGKHYAQKTFRRVGDLSDTHKVEYMPFATRSLSAEHRVKLVDEIIKRQREKFNTDVKLVVIDGIADLVDNTNDIVVSKVVSDYLMKWTNDFKLHIICVIHKNFGENSKPVGHLGSFVTKKAETVFLLNRNDETKDIEVTCDYSRGYGFEPFRFAVGQDSLPYQTDHVEINNTEEFNKESFIDKLEKDDFPF